MEIAIQVFVTTLYAILSILWFMLFIEAIFSWIEATRNHPIYEFLTRITDPVVAPVRALLRRFEFFRNLPFDLSHLFTMVIIGALQAIVKIWL